MSASALVIEQLEFAYCERPVLRLDHLQLAAGESCAVLGPSGCGKTTLLHLIAGLLRPARGSVCVNGQRVHALDASQCDRFRGRHLGIVFQRLHLLPALTVLENLLLAQKLARVPRDAQAARALLAGLGIENLAAAQPSTLSQGQAQRVAIARALLHRPSLVLADEPTSSLDDDNAQRAIELLSAQARAAGAALLVITHDRRIRGRLDRELLLAPQA
ncbi:MAG TPA: ATP-binding cassette domain-containing protein [Fontimonas sp.]